VHSDRDPFVEPMADDLASLTLDLLVSEAGYHRHGLNLMLLFGEPEAAPPPDPGAA
jgi:FdhE protein